MLVHQFENLQFLNDLPRNCQVQVDPIHNALNVDLHLFVGRQCLLGLCCLVEELDIAFLVGPRVQFMLLQELLRQVVSYRPVDVESSYILNNQMGQNPQRLDILPLLLIFVTEELDLELGHDLQSKTAGCGCLN